SQTQLKGTIEILSAKYALLKQLMGYKDSNNFSLTLDTVKMLQALDVDTTLELQYEKRIEYKQLVNNRTIQRQNTRYFKNGFLPSLYAFYNYYQVYQNDDYAKLYESAYPYSYAGINLSLPIFLGFKRIENIRRSKLQEERIDWDEVNLKLQINSEYKQAL